MSGKDANWIARMEAAGLGDHPSVKAAKAALVQAPAADAQQSSFNGLLDAVKATQAAPAVEQPPAGAGSAADGAPAPTPAPLPYDRTHHAAAGHARPGGMVLSGLEHSIKGPVDAMARAVGGPSKPSVSYKQAIYQAANGGDAYARALMATIAGARAEAQRMATDQSHPGGRPAFVPIRDIRSNHLHLINANGTDNVLDMNNEADQAEYLRMSQRLHQKIGLSPDALSAWTDKASSHLQQFANPDQQDYVPPADAGHYRQQ